MTEVMNDNWFLNCIQRHGAQPFPGLSSSQEPRILSVHFPSYARSFFQPPCPVLPPGLVPATHLDSTCTSFPGLACFNCSSYSPHPPKNSFPFLTVVPSSGAFALQPFLPHHFPRGSPSPKGQLNRMMSSVLWTSLGPIIRL